ncbi:hypothetical protein B7486_65960 [cyanobacterium TDX16]|nr:hypothetical protein B7486_65960 [cyanobacterium TDX16]
MLGLKPRPLTTVEGGFTNLCNIHLIPAIYVCMQRTIRIQLKPDTETAAALSQTIEQYTKSFNAVCKVGWEKSLTSGVELHKATYYDHRALTGLPSQLVCAARVKATEANGTKKS